MWCHKSVHTYIAGNCDMDRSHVVIPHHVVYTMLGIILLFIMFCVLVDKKDEKTRWNTTWHVKFANKLEFIYIRHKSKGIMFLRKLSYMRSTIKLDMSPSLKFIILFQLSWNIFKKIPAKFASNVGNKVLQLFIYHGINIKYMKLHQTLFTLTW